VTRRNNVGTLFTPSFTVAAALLFIVLFATLLADMLAPYDPDAIDLSRVFDSPSSEHLLGTDNIGRDSLSRLLFGGRTAISNALLVVTVSCIGGIPLGLLCGYRGGILDACVMRVWDLILAFPALMMGFLFVAVFGRGSDASVIALGIAYIPMISKLSRNMTMTEKTKTYVLAAKSFKFSDVRIVFRHILPNCVPVLLAELTVDVGYAIITLASLSFLGLGVQPPTSDWGMMLQEALVTVRQNPFQALLPGIAIIIVVVSLNMVSDGIQIYLDPEQRKLPSFKRYASINQGFPGGGKQAQGAAGKADVIESGDR